MSKAIQMLLITIIIGALKVQGQDTKRTYRRFAVVEKNGQVVNTVPISPKVSPLWAQSVSQDQYNWSKGPDRTKPLFKNPIPFVLPPRDKSEPFYKHNHQPAITWLPNGDLMAIWYSTSREQGTELTVLASRFRPGAESWDPSSEFFKALNHNMHGSAIFHNGDGIIYHFNGMAPKGATGWAKLALLLRTSTDNGTTWTAAHPISSGKAYALRHQVIAGTFMTGSGILIQACDAYWGMEGPTAIHISTDDGLTWKDPGGDIRGIHAGIVELKNGHLMAFGRGQAVDGMMPLSISVDTGKTWTYKASIFPPIGGGQRLILKRLREGPILFVSFTSADRDKPESQGMIFKDQEGRSFTGHGMYAALSFDEGKTWPTRKLLTPGTGRFNGGAWTQEFTATRNRAEHAGYLAAAQTPDGVIHLISSRLHYRFNLAWLTQ